MTRRPTASEITDDQLDALYAELDTARSAPGIHLGELRTGLLQLVALADTVERPKPTRIHGDEHPMPGHEWDLREERHPHTGREYVWIVRAVDEQDTAGGLVHVSSPESMFPGDDFVPMYVTDARRLAMALLAAADRAHALATGVPDIGHHRTA